MTDPDIRPEFLRKLEDSGQEAVWVRVPDSECLVLLARRLSKNILSELVAAAVLAEPIDVELRRWKLLDHELQPCPQHDLVSGTMDTVTIRYWPSGKGSDYAKLINSTVSVLTPKWKPFSPQTDALIVDINGLSHYTRGEFVLASLSKVSYQVEVYQWVALGKWGHPKAEEQAAGMSYSTAEDAKVSLGSELSNRLIRQASGNLQEAREEPDSGEYDLNLLARASDALKGL